MNQNPKTYSSGTDWYCSTCHTKLVCEDELCGGCNPDIVIGGETFEFARRLYAEEPAEALEKKFERPFPTWEELTNEARSPYFKRAEQAFRIITDMMDGDTCRVCGCTDDAACPGGCSWAEPGLCSNCVDKVDTGPENSREEMAPTTNGTLDCAGEPVAPALDPKMLALELKVDTRQFDDWLKRALDATHALGVACESVGVALDVSSPAPRYFIGADESGHSYIVPVDHAEAWHQWRALPESDPAAWEAPAFARRIVEGGLTFTDPQWF